MSRPTRTPPARAAVLAAVLLCFPAVAPAQDKKPLRFGTDPTGGAPFIYQNAAGKYVGFEVELAEYLARAMGRESQVVPGDWSNLPQQLNKPADIPGGIDVVLNGYELREDLVRDYAVTRPYYVYRLVLMARKDNAAVRGWADLYSRGGGARKTVGVLGGTVAQEYLEKTFGGDIDLKSNQDVANVIELVSDRRLDATVQDGPAATHFLKEYPDLKAAGEPVRPGFYVIYHRKGDAELGRQLDEAIAAGIADGSFRAIYQRYGLWNDDQERLNYWLGKPWPPFGEAGAAGGHEEPDAGNPLPRLAGELVKAAVVTVELALVSFPIALLIGLAVGVGRVYGPWWLAAPLGVYVEVIRGTPLLLQLFMIYYLLPDVVPGLAQVLTPFVAGVVGLAINYSAYEAENYRAGLLAIPKGQMEAALSLGMTRLTALRRVVVPQAVRVVIPPVTNDFIALFKDTSACSIILVVELTRKYNELFNFNRGLIVELAFLTAGLYLLMSYPLAVLAGRLERRLSGPPAGGHR